MKKYSLLIVFVGTVLNGADNADGFIMDDPKPSETYNPYTLSLQQKRSVQTLAEDYNTYVAKIENDVAEYRESCQCTLEQALELTKIVLICNKPYSKLHQETFDDLDQKISQKLEAGNKQVRNEQVRLYTQLATIIHKQANPGYQPKSTVPYFPTLTSYGISRSPGPLAQKASVYTIGPVKNGPVGHKTNQ